jgi:hypothetical protein
VPSGSSALALPDFPIDLVDPQLIFPTTPMPIDSLVELFMANPSLLHLDYPRLLVTANHLLYLGRR